MATPAAWCSYCDSMRALMGFARWFFTLVGAPADFQLLASLIPPAIVAALTSWLGARADEPWHWVLLAGVVAFAATAHGVSYVLGLYRASTIHAKIALVRLETEYIRTEQNGTVSAKLRGRFVNNSDVDVYYKFQDAHYSLSNRIADKAMKQSVPLLIPAKALAIISFPVIRDIPNEPYLEGGLQLKVAYGRLPDRLSKQYHIRAKILIATLMSPPPNSLMVWDIELVVERFGYE